MSLPSHARVALGSALLVAVIGIAMPTTRTATITASSVRITATRLMPRNEVARLVGSRSTSKPARIQQQEADPTPTPKPTPKPVPTPPPPPTAGGLKLMVDPVAFADQSALHPGAPPMQSASGILVDADTHTILWEQNPHQSRPPASTTKIVSSLVALTNFDPHKMVTITPDALTQADDETRMGIQAGETYNVEDLLSGMLTVSANDAATAMAVDTVGMNNFVTAMNAQMQQLGLHDSHFTTPVGLDDPQQYSSAYDLAAVAMEDWDRYAVFRNIVWRDQVNLPQTPGHPQFQLPNLNRLLQIYPAAIGIKPGWTGNAGPCLVGMAVRGGHHLIAVVMNDPVLYTDEAALFQWGYALYGIAPF
jgi:serine-type D-Ala-D-Ala carboxypeptidase (penicillin-binding protein 5/6)